MTATLFVAGALLLAAAVMSSVRRYLSPGAVRLVMLVLPLWLVYVGLLSWTGVVADASLRPPGAIFILLPVFTFIALFAMRSARGLKVAASLPNDLLIGAQVFRVPVELGLHRLWSEGLVPRLMTYEGGNVDICIGLSAPLAAWLATRGSVGRRLSMGWNVLGLLALINIVVRSALTAPGSLNLLHAEVPNLAIGRFPYTFLAGFFVPLAVLLHVLSLRALLRVPVTRSAPGSLEKPGRSVGRSLEVLVPPPLVMAATGLLMWVVARFSPIFQVRSSVDWSLSALLAALSAGLVITGALSFRRFATTIDPTRPGSASKLVTGGIYRFTRNPMYLGFTGVLLAWGLYLQAWWSLPLPLFFGLYITVFQIVPEEDALRSKFGDRYMTYAALVRRWL